MKEKEFVMTDEPCETIDIKKLQRWMRKQGILLSPNFELDYH